MAQGKSFRAMHGNLLLGIPNNKADGTRASSLRMALLWMHEHPEQLAFVRERLTATNPVSLHTHWKKHQSATIKEAVEQGDDHLKLADALDGVSQKEAKAMLDKAKDAKAKREAKAAEAEDQPEPQQQAVDHATAFKALIDDADRAELELMRQIIEGRLAKMVPASTKWAASLPAATLTRRLKVGGTVAVHNLDDDTCTEPVATGVLDGNKLRLTNVRTGEETTGTIVGAVSMKTAVPAFGIAMDLSERQFKITYGIAVEDWQ